jgi:hypothetical protein
MEVRMDMTQLNRTAIAFAVSALALTACATWPFSSGPKDIRVMSVTKVNQAQLNLGDSAPLPSKIILRIEFTTDTDLLALAKKNEYNIDFDLGPCSKNGVEDMGVGYGYVYWNNLHVYSGAKATREYESTMAKGPPFAYQIYASQWQQTVGQAPMCFMLGGGNMVGGRLKSNVVRLPR